MTYPPDFHYVTRSEVRAIMTEMADSVITIDDSLRDEADADQQKTVIKALERMQKAMAKLSGVGPPTNHPMFAERLGKLQTDVGAALTGAGQTPPNYFFAGSLVGSCLYCHGRGQ